MSNYGIEQMHTLQDIDAVRLRPGMYIGSVEQDGIHHLVKEIMANSIDEYMAGECDTIHVIIAQDNIVIEDNGRGIPFENNEKGIKTFLEAATVLHSGGKFDSSGNAGYNTSGGMNGVGLTVTNALSSYCEVSSTRNGETITAIFSKGVLEECVVENSPKQKNGTIVSFIPDKEIFKTTTLLNKNRLFNEIQESSFLSSNLKFDVSFNGENKVFLNEEGLSAYVKVLSTNSEPLTEITSIEEKKDGFTVKAAFRYVQNYSENGRLYTNSIPNTAGTHLTGFRSALTTTFNEFGRNMGLIKTNLTGDDLREGLVYVLAIEMVEPVFSGQTKDVLNTAEARTIVQQIVSEKLKEWLILHPTDGEIIVRKALKAQQVREATKQARDAARDVNTTVKVSRVLASGKLADCNSRKRGECELFLVEGNSAGGNAKEARNREFQAVLPLKGKTINTYTASFAKTMSNQEVKDMVSAIGLEVNTSRLIYNPAKMRYGKIVLLTDSDSDGSHIDVLLITLFWKYCPELFLNGHIYFAMPPLFKVVKGDERIYFKDAEELQNYLEENPLTGNATITRHKGLGEMNVSELEDSVMDKNTRVLEQIIIENEEEFEIAMQKLMGSSAAPRKQFFMERGGFAEVDI